MNRIRTWWVAAVVVALGIGLASCGAPAESEAGQATLEVSSFPAADIWIDGKWKGSTPASLTVDPGAHEVVLRQSGFGEHEETIDLTAGSHRTVECVLIAQDLDDGQVLAHLARPFDVTVEPFEAPERHRGGRKAPLAALLWPKGDIRPVGLTSFAVEVSEEYEGDGYLVFRKGKNILYKEVFDPETLTTVATIPLHVLQQTDVGDTVTWGIVFDSRRKHDVEGRFKVVNRPKADNRLSKMAYDRHLERQPPLTRALLEATALENYRLYSEALVRSLEIVQEHPTSVSPYQRIVTTLRRLDGEDTRLWNVASQFVSGSGRARASRSGIAAFAPQQAQALPVPSVPPAVAAVPDTSRPMQPGDAVKPGLRSSPDAGGAPAKADPQAGSSGASPSAGGAAERATLLGQAAEEAGRVAEGKREEADAAAAKAAKAKAALDQARASAKSRHEMLAEAERQAAEDPSPENQEAVDVARRQAEEADDEVARAEQQAGHAGQEAEGAREEALNAQRSVESLADKAKAARREVEEPAASGPGQPARGAPVEPTRPDKVKEGAGPAADDSADVLAERVVESQQGVNVAQAEVTRLEELAEASPGDEGVQEQLDAAREELAQATKARADALAAYAAATAGPARGEGEQDPAHEDPAPPDAPEPDGGDHAE